TTRPATRRLYRALRLFARSQGHRASILLPCTLRRTPRHCIICADAGPPGSTATEAALLRSDQAGGLPCVGHHAWHADGLLCIDHGTTRRIRKLFSAFASRRARDGVPHAEHAVVLDDVPGVSGLPRC